MDHEADGRFVDPHPEGAGGHHDLDLVVEETAQRLAALFDREPRVEWCRADASGREAAGDPFGQPTSGHVDEGGPVVGAEEGQETVPPFPLAPDARDTEPEVAAVEGTEVEIPPAPRGTPRAEAEGAGDVGAHIGGGAAGEGDDRRAPELPPETAQTAIGGAEVVPPLGHTVGLIHRQQDR